MIEEATSIDVLRGLALDQYGYVTASQAVEVGVSKPALSMLTKRKRIKRVAYGVYRIPQVPATEYDRFMLAVLWTGAEEAVLSHETALDLYNICDINPNTIHLTLAKGRRIARQGGEFYTLHFEDLQPGDCSWHEGLPVVSARKAIEQCIESGMPNYLLEQALANARSRGLILKREATLLCNCTHTRNREDQSE